MLGGYPGLSQWDQRNHSRNAGGSDSERDVTEGAERFEDGDKDADGRWNMEKAREPPGRTHLDFGRTSRTIRSYVCVALSQEVCGIDY